MMNLNEEINRIKEVMGVLKESKILLPMIVSGSFKGEGGDRSHAFQSTNGVVVGGMQTKVNAELKKVYNAGYNPDITNLKVTVDLSDNTTYWEVTIDKSKDGEAYVGIVTVGSCCSKTFEKRADDQVEKMKTWNSSPENHKLITVLKTTNEGTSNGNLTIENGKYKLKQHFYKYTKDNKKPH